VKAPYLHERADCDVEGSTGAFAVGHAFGKQLEQLVRHPHRAACGAAIHLAQLAGRPVIRQHSVEPVDLLECGVGCILERETMIAVQHHGEGRPHGFIGSLDALDLTRGQRYR
jgi:hypothetical protein